MWSAFAGWYNAPFTLGLSRYLDIVAMVRAADA
jgi:hypothetical protein